jgi:CheY-like chemotaxis protein
VARRLTKPVTQSELLNAITTVLGAACGDEAPTESFIARRGDAFASRRVLLAEDGLVNQKVAMTLLEKRGHRVTLVNNGREAVEATAAARFDVVLMDVQMPVMDGLAATEAIRQRERDSQTHLPIFAMTAHAMKGDRQRCLDAGMDGYIAKPFRPQELFEMVESTATTDDRPSLGEVDVSTAAAELPYDHQRALANVGGSRSLFRDMVELFATERTVQMEAIRRARADGDNDQLSRAAHTLKGSVSMFASQAAFDAALAIETMANENNLAEYDATWQRLHDEIDRLMKALQETVGENA